MGESTGKSVGKQNARQMARRAASDAQAKMRAQRVEREKRVSALGVQAMVALGDRDEVVARCERRAGEALRAMTEDEGLGLAEAVQWCGEGMTRREATRLRAVVERCEQVRAGDGDGLVVRERRRVVGRLSRWEHDGLTSNGWRFCRPRWQTLRR